MTRSGNSEIFGNDPLTDVFLGVQTLNFATLFTAKCAKFTWLKKHVLYFVLDAEIN